MKKYIFPYIFLLAGTGCFLSYWLIGSKVGEDGTLIEPFFLIPFGFIAVSLGVILGALISGSSLFKEPKLLDRLTFGIMTMIIGVFLIYLFVVTVILG